MSNKVLSRPTQIQQVLKYLEAHGSITAYEATYQLGIMSLSRRICDLRDMGFKFHAEMIEERSRFGEKINGKRFKIKEYPAKMDENGQFQIKI